MSGFRFNRQDSDEEDEHPYPNSRRTSKRRESHDDEDERLPTSCSTKEVKGGSKIKDFFLMLLMIMGVSGSIYYLQVGGYTLEVVQLSPTNQRLSLADPTVDLTETLKHLMENVKNVSALSMKKHHELKSDLTLEIKGTHYEPQHLTLQLMTFEHGDRAKVESAAGKDHASSMQQGNLLKNAERIQ